jgi:hypothetical protein
MDGRLRPRQRVQQQAKSKDRTGGAIGRHDVMVVQRSMKVLRDRPRGAAAHPAWLEGIRWHRSRSV